MAGITQVVKQFTSECLAELCPSYFESELAAAFNDHWRIDPPGAYCHRCGLSVGPGEATAAGCSGCVNRRIAWDGIVRLSPYADPVRHWIVSMKFAGAWRWAAWFGDELARVIDHPKQSRPVAVCPVPMHWGRRIRRGYNQAHLMALSLGRSHGWPVFELISRVRYTPPQTAAALSGRAANMRRAFGAKPVDLTGWHLWLVDDVKTTGSTLTACARLLRKAGADRVDVAVAAVTDP